AAKGVGTTAPGRNRQPAARAAAGLRRKSGRDRSSRDLRERRIKCRNVEPQPPGQGVVTICRLLGLSGGSWSMWPARSPAGPLGQTANRAESSPEETEPADRRPADTPPLLEKPWR